MEKEFIYVLQLRDNKYYVGKTYNVEARFAQHVEGKGGAAFTSKFAPIAVLESYVKASEFDEDKTVKEYMSKYGITNVRGGAYCQEHLKSEDYERLTREIWHAKGACLRCGRNNHFATECFAQTDIEGFTIKATAASQGLSSKSFSSSLSPSISSRPSFPLKSAPFTLSGAGKGGSGSSRRGGSSGGGGGSGGKGNGLICFHCGKPGHASTTCYAKQRGAGREMSGSPGKYPTSRSCRSDQRWRGGPSSSKSSQTQERTRSRSRDRRSGQKFHSKGFIPGSAKGSRSFQKKY